MVFHKDLDIQPVRHFLLPAHHMKISAQGAAEILLRRRFKYELTLDNPRSPSRIR